MKKGALILIFPDAKTWGRFLRESADRITIDADNLKAFMADWGVKIAFGHYKDAPAFSIAIPPHVTLKTAQKTFGDQGIEFENLL